MNPETIQIISHKLIPDLTNIVNQYLLTPSQYYKLIDHKKYTITQYYEFWDLFEIEIARKIYKDYVYEINQIYENIRTYDNKLLEKYIGLLITAFDDANIFKATKFERIADKIYRISGQQLYNYFLITPSTQFIIIEYTISNSDIFLNLVIRDVKTLEPLEYSHQHGSFKSLLWDVYINIIRYSYSLESEIKLKSFTD